MLLPSEIRMANAGVLVRYAVKFPDVCFVYASREDMDANVERDAGGRQAGSIVRLFTDRRS